MYQHLPVIESALAAAGRPEETVLRDRNEYAPFFEIAEKYAHGHNLIIGGATATLLLQGKELGPEDFFYEFYSTDAHADARALTDLIYEAAPEGRARYAAMVSRAAATPEFEIVVDERSLFLVKSLKIHRGAHIVNVLVPSMRPAKFARGGEGRALQLLCMGPEVQLISIYSALSDPSRASEWARLVGAEEKLRTNFENEIRGKLAAALDGSRIRGGADKPAHELAAALLREYVPLAGHALVGPFGIRALAGKALQNASGRIQLVTANTFRAEEQAIRKIANRLGFSVNFAQHELQVPTESTLRRLTLYLRTGGRREPLLDVFNSGEFQLVACKRVPTKGGDFIMCGTPFTILQFILVDIWTIQLLFRMEAITAQIARRFLKDLVEVYTDAAAIYLAARDAEEFDAIFSSEYIGQFRDPIIAAKRDRFRSGGGGRSYYPIAAKKSRAGGLTLSF